MPLDNSYTSPSYNSYVLDVSQMDSLVAKLEGFYDITSWTNLTSGQVKENLIIQATNDLNSFDFIGELNKSVVSPNNMRWPRKDAFYENGVSIAFGEIPNFVLKYLSIRVLESLANVQTGAYDSNKVKRQKLGDLEQEFFSPGERRTLKNTIKKNPSFEIIKPYVTSQSGSMRYLQRA